MSRKNDSIVGKLHERLRDVQIRGRNESVVEDPSQKQKRRVGSSLLSWVTGGQIGLETQLGENVVSAV